MRRALVILLAVLLVPLALLALVLGWFQTGPGKRQLAGLIEAAASTSESSIVIGGIEGFVPFDITVTDVALADRDGVWLTLDRARLDWVPADLLGGTLHVERLEAGTVEVQRRPLPGPPEPDAPERSGSPIPDLPVDVQLDRLAIDQVALAAPVLGAPARFTAEGSARLGDPSDGLTARLLARRTDATPGTATLDLAYVPDAERLSIALLVDEPAGGLIARAANLPGLPPVRVTLDGDGPLGNWTARLAAHAEGAFDADAEARIREGEAGRVLTLRGDAKLAALLDDATAPLVEGGIEMSAAALVPATGPVVIRHALVATAAGAVNIGGTVDPASGTLDLGYRIDAGRPDSFRGLLPDAAWRTATLSGRVAGPFDQPTITAEAAAVSVTAAGVRFAALGADLRVAPSGPVDDPETRIAVTSSGTVDGLAVGTASVDGAVDWFGGAPINWTLDGAADRTGDVALETFRIELPSGSLAATGTLAGWGVESADLDARLAVPDLAALSPLAGRPLAGALSLAVEATIEDRVGTADLRGEVTDAATGIPQIDALLGARTTLTGRLALLPDGEAELSELRLDGAQIDAAAAGVLTGRGLAFDWSVALPDLAAVDPTLAGQVTAQGNLSGPIEQPTALAGATATDLSIAGRDIPEARLDIAARDLRAAPAGRLDLAATIEGLPASASGQLVTGADGAFALDDLILALGGVRLDGAMARAADGTFTGALEGAAADLAELSAVAGQPLSGRTNLSVVLDAPSGRQHVSLRAEARGVAYGDTVGIGVADVAVQVEDALGAPRVAVDLSGADIKAAGHSIATLTASAEGPLDGLRVALDAEGDPLALSAAATVARADTTTRITIDSADGRYADQPFTIAEGAALTLAPDSVRFEGVRLAAADGSIAVDGTYGPTLDLSVTIAELPLGLSRLVAPDLGLAGTLDGQARLTGTRAAPLGEFSLRVAGLQLPQTVAAGIRDPSIALDGRLAGDRLDATATLAIPDGGELRVEAALPVRIDPATGVPAVPDDGAASLAATGRLDLALVNPLLAGGADQVGGAVDLALRLDGTLGSFVGEGTLALSGGRYTNSLNGTTITDIEAVLTASGDRLTLTRLSGATPGGGRLSGSGTVEINPQAGFPADLAIVLDGARLIDQDIVTATVDADLTLTGPLLTDPLLAGTIGIQTAEIRVPSALPPSTPTIAVTEVNVPSEIAARRREEGAASAGTDSGSAYAVALDLAIDAPQQVYVRGRGLDSEMGGRLTVTGTSAAPVIEGALNLRRGTLDLLGNRFDFDRGSVTMTGDAKLDPLLDFLASSEIGDIVAQIAVTGRASAPVITISSTPELPEDEVLARILFGKATAELSAIEAVQLAQSVASLTGLSNGPGILDRVRNATGLDRIEVGTNEAGATNVTAGRYVAEGVFIGVEQGLAANSSRATVEIEVTPNITVESDVGANSDSRVGVTFEWDY